MTPPVSILKENLVSIPDINAPVHIDPALTESVAPAQQQPVAPTQAQPTAPAQFAPVQALPPAPSRPSNGVALTAMILGIVGAVTGVWAIIPVTGYFSAAVALPLVAAAVICGHIGNSRAKRIQGVGSGFARTGIILGYATLAFVIVASVAWTVFLFVGSV